MQVLYDITRQITPDISVWPGDTHFHQETIMQMSAGHSVNLTTLHLSAHTGTHADAWWHYDEEGARIGAMPLDHYLGMAQVVSLQLKSGPITPEIFDGIDLANAERILFHTPMSNLPDNQWPESFPYLTVELIDFLAARGIVLIGVDSPSVDEVSSKVLPCHKRLLTHRMVNLESLWLRDVPDGRYELIALPLRLSSACGSPVRAVLRTL